MATTMTDTGTALWERIHNIPALKTFGITVETASQGRCRLIMPRSTAHDGIFESFHGGLMMAAADMAACFAILSQIDPQEVVTTTDMNIRFLSGCLTDLIAEARVVKIGRTLCPATVDLYDTTGKLVAIAQVTYMRLPKLPERS